MRKQIHFGADPPFVSSSELYKNARRTTPAAWLLVSLLSVMELSPPTSLSHLDPLDSNLSDLSSRTSTELSLVQYHIEADTFDPSLPLPVFHEGNRTILHPEETAGQSQLHTIDLSKFDPSSLPSLDKHELALLPFHPRTTQALQTQAETVWRSRSETYFSRGLRWEDRAFEGNGPCEEKVVMGESTRPRLETSMEITSVLKCERLQEDTPPRPRTEMEMELNHTKDSSRTERQLQPQLDDQGTPPRPGVGIPLYIPESTLPCSRSETVLILDQEALSPPHISLNPSSPTTSTLISHPTTSSGVAPTPFLRALDFSPISGLSLSSAAAAPFLHQPREDEIDSRLRPSSLSPSPELIILALPHVPSGSTSLPRPLFPVPAQKARPSLPIISIPPRPSGSFPLSSEYSSLIYSLKLSQLPSTIIYNSTSLLLSLFPARHLETTQPIAAILLPPTLKECLRSGYVGFRSFDERTEVFQRLILVRMLGGATHSIGVEFVEENEEEESVSVNEEVEKEDENQKWHGWRWKDLDDQWAEDVWRRSHEREREVEVEEMEAEGEEIIDPSQFTSSAPAPTVTPTPGAILEPSLDSAPQATAEVESSPLPPHEPDTSPTSFPHSTLTTLEIPTRSNPSPPVPGISLDSSVPFSISHLFPQLLISFHSLPPQIQKRKPYQFLNLISILGIQPLTSDEAECKNFYLAFESKGTMRAARKVLERKWFFMRREYGMKVRVEIGGREGWRFGMFTRRGREAVSLELRDRDLGGRAP